MSASTASTRRKSAFLSSSVVTTSSSAPTHITPHAAQRITVNIFPGLNSASQNSFGTYSLSSAIFFMNLSNSSALPMISSGTSRLKALLSTRPFSSKAVIFWSQRKNTPNAPVPQT